MTKKQIDALLKKHALGPCSHPDCGPRGVCASSYIHRRAEALVREAARIVRREARREAVR